MQFKLFLDLKCWHFRIILYLCARFEFSKTDNFFSDHERKVFQNGQLPTTMKHKIITNNMMEIKNFTITKRDGSQAQFSLDKIMNAIVKAFDSVN